MLSPLDWHALLVAFGLVFLSELGDKTQLTTLMLAADGGKVWPVFFGAATALVVVALGSALLGDVLFDVLPVRSIHVAAAILFIVIGILLLLRRI